MLVLVKRIDSNNELDWGNNRAFVASVLNDTDLSNYIHNRILINSAGEPVLKSDGQILTVKDLKITEIKDEGLPIDFQIQERNYANKCFEGPREPIGILPFRK